jgi:6,7-dimethyl-8-ribityllumazine synthase
MSETPPGLAGQSLGWPEARLAIVASRFNEFVVRPLIDGALDALERHGLARERILLLRVPGAWEIPVLAARLARSGRYDGIVTLGAVIRGETPHFEHVAGPVAASLAALQVDTGIPIGFGVLTVEDTGQAIERAGGKAGNKGAEAALACLETAALIARLGRDGAV